MPFSTTADAQGLDALNASFGAYSPVIAYASLHSAYSASGANELSGGSPAYARVSLSWSAASAGSGTKALSTSPSAFNVPASSAVAFIGLWSASSGGTFAGMGANGGNSQFGFTAATAGNLFTAPGTSYAANQAVVMFPGPGGTMPGNFSAGIVYYVVSPSAGTFLLSATSGGGAITVASAGSGLIQAIVVETYGSQGTFSVTSDTLAII